jgi:hypothetical protein
MTDLAKLLESLEVTFAPVFLGFSEGVPNSPDSKWEHFSWSVTVSRAGKSYTTTYRTGTAHVHPMPRAFMAGDHDRVRAKAWLRHPKAPKAPDAASVVACLMSDGQAGQELFEDYCANYGASPDSRKALETYLECQRAYSAMRSLFREHFDAVATAAQDY